MVHNRQKGFGVIKTKYYREKKKLENCLHNYGKDFPNKRESCPLKLLQFCAFSLQLKRFSKRFYTSLVRFYHFYSHFQCSLFLVHNWSSSPVVTLSIFHFPSFHRCSQYVWHPLLNTHSLTADMDIGGAEIFLGFPFSKTILELHLDM